MLKPKLHSTIGVLLLLAVLSLAVTASGYTYKKPAGHDCGRVTFTGGFGGPPPSNVPQNAIPQVHTFVEQGKVACATARSVMARFEKSFSTPAGAGKGISPAGWKCAFSKKLKGNACTNAKHATISDAIVYVVPKH